MTAGQAGLRAAIFGEIKGRTKETDLSVPTRKGGWWYYSRTVEGKQYAVYCRRAVASEDERPPMTAGRLAAGRRADPARRQRTGRGPVVLLARRIQKSARTAASSPTRPTTPATSGTRCDSRTWSPARSPPTRSPDTYYGAAWSLDGSALFYVTVDAAWRPYRIWRHLLGTPVEQDAVVFEESDERFFAGVWLTRSERYLVIATS